MAVGIVRIRDRAARSCYQKELYDTPNIHALGWLLVNGPEFHNLMRTCAYVIHPTCSDGQSGSVVQCMYSGLIPLVTREAGIDTEDFGVTFSDDSLDEIERVVREVSQLPEEWHRERSIKTRKAAETKYGEDAFLSRWRHILGEILNRAEPSAAQRCLDRNSPKTRSDKSPRGFAGSENGLWNGFPVMLNGAGNFILRKETVLSATRSPLRA